MRGWEGKGRTTQAVIGEAADGVFRIDIRRTARTAWSPVRPAPASPSCCRR